MSISQIIFLAKSIGIAILRRLHDHSLHHYEFAEQQINKQTRLKARGGKA